MDTNYPPSQVKAQVKAHDSAQCVAFRPQGNKLASAGADGYVKLWTQNLSVSEKRELKICNGPVSTVAFNQTGSLIAAGDASSQIAMLKIKPGMEISYLL